MLERRYCVRANCQMQTVVVVVKLYLVRGFPGVIALCVYHLANLMVIASEYLVSLHHGGVCYQVFGTHRITFPSTQG